MRRRRYRPQLTARERAQMVGPLRACCDCNNYTPVNQLIDKKDGRKICPGCEDKVKQITAQRSQLEMFGQQPSLLSLLK